MAGWYLGGIAAPIPEEVIVEEDLEVDAELSMILTYN